MPAYYCVDDYPLYQPGCIWEGVIKESQKTDQYLGDRVLAEIAPYVPSFRCVLDDLGEESEETLRARAMSALGRLALWCLKNSRSPEQLVAQLGRWGELMRQVARAPDGMAALTMIFR